MLSSVCATCADVPTLLVKAAGGLSVELSKERLSLSGAYRSMPQRCGRYCRNALLRLGVGAGGAGRARAMSAAPSVAGLCPINNGWPFQYNKHVKLTELNRTGVKTHCKIM